MEASNCKGTGPDTNANKLLRPEWVRDGFFVADGVDALDAPEMMPAGACWQYEPIFYPGEAWPLQQVTYRASL